MGAQLSMRPHRLGAGTGQARGMGRQEARCLLTLSWQRRAMRRQKEWMEGVRETPVGLKHRLIS